MTNYDRDYVRNQNHEQNADRFRRLLRGVQELVMLEQIECPDWSPPDIEDLVTHVDLARSLLGEAHKVSEMQDWNNARVWREMYAREWAVSDALRKIAQNLDEKLQDGVRGLDHHNDMLDDLSSEARRLELDLGL